MAEYDFDVAPRRRNVRAGKAPARSADQVLEQPSFQAQSGRSRKDQSANRDVSLLQITEGTSTSSSSRPAPAGAEPSRSEQTTTKSPQAQPETASELILRQLIPLQLQQSRQLEALSLNISGIQRRLDSLNRLRERIVMVERMLGRVESLAESTKDIAMTTREGLAATAATIGDIWTSVDGTAGVVDGINENVEGLGRQGDQIVETIDNIETKVKSVGMTVDDVYSKSESIEDVVTGTEHALDGIRETINGLDAQGDDIEEKVDGIRRQNRAIGHQVLQVANAVDNINRSHASKHLVREMLGTCASEETSQQILLQTVQIGSASVASRLTQVERAVNNIQALLHRQLEQHE